MRRIMTGIGFASRRIEFPNHAIVGRHPGKHTGLRAFRTSQAGTVGRGHSITTALDGGGDQGGPLGPEETSGEDDAGIERGKY